MYTTIPAQHFISSSLLFIKIIFLFLSFSLSFIISLSLLFLFLFLFSDFNLHHFYLPFLSLHLLPFFSIFFFFFFVGRLRGSWVAQLVDLAMGFGGFFIRVAVVSNRCWWFPVDVAGFSDGDCERITRLWFWILTAIVEASQPRWDAVRSWACISISSSSLSLSFFFFFLSAILLFLHFGSSKVCYFFANEMMNMSF